VRAQQAVGQAVEGPDPHAADRLAEQALDAVRISRAALLVKVTARMPQGDSPSTWISHAMRCTSTRVLPDPAPARTSVLPAGQ
jgi:hypothetical protein